MQGKTGTQMFTAVLFCNNENIKTTQMSISKWRNTQNVVYPCKGSYLAMKKNEVLNTCYANICLENTMLRIPGFVKESTKQELKQKENIKAFFKVFIQDHKMNFAKILS